MLTWLTRTPSSARRTKSAPTHKTNPARRPGVLLRLEALEQREVPAALTIQLDYSFDSSGFFNPGTAAGQQARSTLQLAANDIASRLDVNLSAISPGGANTWSAIFFNPATGAQQTVANLTVGANTLVVYAGGRDLPGTEAGVGGFGGYSASGYADWFTTLKTRNQGGYSTWGGSLSFDTNGTNWNRGTGTPGAGAVDFYSVASHELGHLLGLGTSTQWFGLVSGGTFRGANASAVNGGPVAVSADGAHWGNGVKGGGCHCALCAGTAAAATTANASLNAYLTTGTRVGFSELDFAALKDLGWGVRAPGAAAASALVTVSPPVAPPPPPTIPGAPAANVGKGDLVSVSGGGGTVQLFRQGTDGLLRAVSGGFTPFVGYGGTIRSATADFDGDGVKDVAVGTGAGVTGMVKVYSGKTYQEIVGASQVLGGFTGGVFLAAGDIDRDGKAELFVSADRGGSPRVTIFKVGPGGLTTVNDFFAFDGDNFAGGARIAVGDVNGDGFADLVCVAGPTGGPRVSTYSGASLKAGGHARLFNDFFAMDPSLRIGLWVSVGDTNGDGKADLVFSADNGGSSRIAGYSGSFLVSNPGIDPLTAPQFFTKFTTEANGPQGARVTFKDLDGNGTSELIVTTAVRSNSTLRAWGTSDLFGSAFAISPAPLQKPVGDAIDFLGLFVG